MPGGTDYAGLSGRIERLEDDMSDVKMSLARREETLNHVNGRLSNIEDLIRKLMWLVVGGIGAAFIAFVIGGGLDLTRIAPIPV